MRTPRRPVLALSAAALGLLVMMVEGCSGSLSSPLTSSTEASSTEPCTELLTCCAALTGPSMSACTQIVVAGVAADCAAALGANETSGACGATTTSPGTQPFVGPGSGTGTQPVSGGGPDAGFSPPGVDDDAGSDPFSGGGFDAGTDPIGEDPDAGSDPFSGFDAGTDPSGGDDGGAGGGDGDSGITCSHSPCVAGSALVSGCDDAVDGTVSGVCQTSGLATCCTQAWTSACVQAAVQACSSSGADFCCDPGC